MNSSNPAAVYCDKTKYLYRYMYKAQHSNGVMYSRGVEAVLCVVQQYRYHVHGQYTRVHVSRYTGQLNYLHFLPFQGRHCYMYTNSTQFQQTFATSTQEENKNKSNACHFHRFAPATDQKLFQAVLHKSFKTLGYHAAPLPPPPTRRPKSVPLAQCCHGSAPNAC